MFSVGLFLLAGLSIVGWMILSFGGSNKVKDAINLTVQFEDASGIIEGGIVRLAGAHVGEVVSAPRLNENYQVEVDIAIREDLKIPSNAKFKITSLSLLGDKAIYIIYPEKAATTLIKDGDHMQGISPKGLDKLQEQAEELTAKVNEVLVKTDSTFSEVSDAISEYKLVAKELNISIDRLNESVFSEESLAKLDGTVDNLNTTSAEINEFAKTLRPLSADTKIALSRFMSVAEKTNQLVENADKLMVTTNEQMIALRPAINELPSTLKTYRETGKSLQSLTKKLDGAVGNKDSLVGVLTSDSEIKNDAETFVKNLKDNGILGYKDNSDPNSEDPRDRYRGVRR